MQARIDPSEAHGAAAAPELPGPAAARGETMQAIVQPGYGAPDVLRLEQVARPTVGDEEVLVRVRAAAVSRGDVHLTTGKPYVMRALFGLRRPRWPVVGMDMAGEVRAVGRKVTRLHVGDEVFGEVQGGAFGEFLCAPEELLVTKPAGLSFEQAAALPWAVTALQGLRDAGRLRSGQHVLINGASGGVGCYAVQLARHFGAHVTAVCSTRNVQRVRALGADEVIDYTREDFARDGGRFDLLFDLVGNRSLKDCKRALRPGGSYVGCSGQVGGDWIGPLAWIAGVTLAGVCSSRRMTAFITKPDAQDLGVLKELVERGALAPVIDRCYASLGEVPDALRYVAEGHAQGKVVVRV